MRKYRLSLGILFIFTFAIFVQTSIAFGWTPDGVDFPAGNLTVQPKNINNNLSITLLGDGDYDGTTYYGFDDVNDENQWNINIPAEYYYGQTNLYIEPAYKSTETINSYSRGESNTPASYGTSIGHDNIYIEPTSWQTTIPKSRGIHSYLFSESTTSGAGESTTIYNYVPSRVSDGDWQQIAGGSSALGQGGLGKTGRAHSSSIVTDYFYGDAKWELKSLNFTIGISGCYGGLSYISYSADGWADAVFKIYNHKTKTYEEMFYNTDGGGGYQNLNKLFSSPTTSFLTIATNYQVNYQYMQIDVKIIFPDGTLVDDYSTGPSFGKRAFNFYFETNAAEGIWNQWARSSAVITEFDAAYEVAWNGIGSGARFSSTTIPAYDLLQAKMNNTNTYSTPNSNTGVIYIRGDLDWGSARLTDNIQVRCPTSTLSSTIISYNIRRYEFSQWTSLSDVQLRYYRNGWQTIFSSSGLISIDELQTDPNYNNGILANKLRLYSISNTDIDDFVLRYRIDYNDVRWTDNASTINHYGRKEFNQEDSTRYINENWVNIRFENSPYLVENVFLGTDILSMSITSTVFDFDGFPRYTYQTTSGSLNIISWQNYEIELLELSWNTDNNVLDFHSYSQIAPISYEDDIKDFSISIDYDSTEILDAWVIFHNTDTNKSNSFELTQSLWDYGNSLWTFYDSYYVLNGTYEYWYLLRENSGNWITTLPHDSLILYHTNIDIDINQLNDYEYQTTNNYLDFNISYPWTDNLVWNIFVDGNPNPIRSGAYLEGINGTFDINIDGYGVGEHILNITVYGDINQMNSITQNFTVYSYAPEIIINNIPDYNYGDVNIFAEFTIFTNYSWGYYNAYIDNNKIYGSDKVFTDGVQINNIPIYNIPSYSSGIHNLTVKASNQEGLSTNTTQIFGVLSSPPEISIIELSNYASDSTGNILKFSIHDSFEEFYKVMIDDNIVDFNVYSSDFPIIINIDHYDKGYHEIGVWVNNSAGDEVNIISHFYVISTDIFITFDKDSYDIIDWDNLYIVYFNLSIESYIISNFTYSIMDVSSQHVYLSEKINYVDGVLEYIIPDIEPKDLPNGNNLQLQISVLDFLGYEHIFTRDMSVNYYLPNSYINWDLLIDYDSDDVDANGYVEATINFDYYGYLAYSYRLELPSWVADIVYDNHFAIHRNNKIYYPISGEQGLSFSFDEKPNGPDTLTFRIKAPTLMPSDQYGEFETGVLDNGKNYASLELILSSDFVFTDVKCLYLPFIALNDGGSYTFVLEIYDDGQWVETDLELVFTGDHFDQEFSFFVSEIRAGESIHFRIYGTMVPVAKANYAPLAMGAIFSLVSFGFVWSMLLKKPLTRKFDKLFKKKWKFYGVGAVISAVVFGVAYFGFASSGLIAGALSITKTGLSPAMMMTLIIGVSVIGGLSIGYPFYKNKYGIAFTHYKPPKIVEKQFEEWQTVVIPLKQKNISK